MRPYGLDRYEAMEDVGKAKWSTSGKERHKTQGRDDTRRTRRKRARQEDRNHCSDLDE